jgi:hypothetical protein
MPEQRWPAAKEAHKVVGIVAAVTSNFYDLRVDQTGANLHAL